MKQNLRIRIDYDKCVGSRICIAVAPAAFRLNDEGQGAVINTDEVLLDVVRLAAEACPMSAIVVEDRE